MASKIQDKQSDDYSSRRSAGYQQLPYTQSHDPGQEGQPKSKKKWFIGGGVLLLLIAAVVVIVVVVTGKKTDGGGDNPPGPPPPPPTPPVIGFNPYFVETANRSNGELAGTLRYNGSAPGHEAWAASKRSTEELFQGRTKKEDVGAEQVGVDSEGIASSLGPNNEYVDAVSYTFGQVGYKTTVLSLQAEGDDSRFDIPQELVAKQSSGPQFRLDMVDLEYKSKPFSFSFASTLTGEKLVDSAGQTFVFQEKFIQVDFKVPTAFIYGFGERDTSFQLGRGAWTMWSQGEHAEFDDGRGGKQLAGMHPFCLIKANQSDEFFGIFFRSSNAQAPIISLVEGSNILSYVTTGGNLDINFFLRGSAKEVIAAYQQFIGLPQLPPFWALGWHAGSNAWDTLEDVKEVVGQYDAKGFPLESIWLDGNYMDAFADFTVDETAFPHLKDYTATLQGQGRKVVLKLYGGLANDKHNTYVIESEGAQIKYANGTPFDAPTLSNSTRFLDWFHSQAKSTWRKGLFALWDSVPFDGLWLDQNAPEINCNGGPPNCTYVGAQRDLHESSRRRLEEDVGSDYTWYQHYGSEFMKNNSTYYLPFIPQLANLDRWTIALNATHYNSTSQQTYMEYDVHSLFGHMQAKITAEILDSDKSPLRDRRNLISSTSTFAGSGQYAQHHRAGQRRTWQHLKASIAHMMNFNMFGMPFTGADVCGSKVGSPDQSKEEQEEICARWYQLSTFYPLARTNRDKAEGGIGIEPFELPGGNGSAYEIAYYSVLERYKYARLTYECLFAASQTGQTCFDPMFYRYPSFPLAYDSPESTFLVADAIKVSPILKPLKKNETFEVFFPAGQWVDMDNYTVVDVSNILGENITLAPETTVKKHLRPGAIVPVQYNDTNGTKLYANSTDQLATTGIHLMINRDAEGFAAGKLLLDEGKNISEVRDGDYEYYEFRLVNKTLQKVTLNSQKLSTGTQGIASVIITNAADLSKAAKACMITRSGIASEPLSDPEYNSETQTLTIRALKNEDINAVQLQMIHVEDPEDPYSLCDVASAGWHVDNTTWDPSALNASQASVPLVSAKYPGLNLSMSLQMGNAALLGQKEHHPMINIKVDVSGIGRVTYEVPSDIVDVADALADCKGHHCNLSEFVLLNTSKTPAPLITVVTNTSDIITPLWSLDAVIQDDFLNLMSTTAYTGAVNTSSNGTFSEFRGILGLAERTSTDLFLPDGVYSLWARDAATPPETGELPATNIYGVHPFYMAPAADLSWYGVYTNLAAAQDWWVTNDQTNGMVNLTTVASGGLTDVTILIGATPNDVTRRYHDLVGKPVLTPMWALGWHQCRWGYKSTDALRDVVSSYEEKNLPLDAAWSDIDYMHDYRDFTVDPLNYADLGDFVHELHNKSLHYIPILDAGIAQREGGNYSAYNTGKEKDVFIKAFPDGPDFTGQVWPTDAVYPDFFSTPTVQWWHDQLDAFHKEVPFDGLWQDMNEASNFCNGPCYSEQVSETKLKHKLPYTPTGRDLETKSIALDAVHNRSVDPGEAVTELDAHSLFGTMQVKASNEWFDKQSMRTMIISRSSFSGFGKFGSKWLGDNRSTYDSMATSVTGVMMQNIIGIPLAGADICGFGQNTSAPLCARWYTVGAFYPFSRNHNGLDSTPQEPYQFDYKSKEYPQLHYMEMIKIAMQTKMALINYYYTEISMLNETGGAFYRPLFFDYPKDPDAYLNQTLNVMLGAALKLSVQSGSNQTETEFYFPEGYWCNVFNASSGCINGPMKVNMSSRMYQYDVHLKDGHIVPLQADVVTPKSTVLSTHDIQQNPIDIHIHPQFELNVNGSEQNIGGSCNATGRFLNDDGYVVPVLGLQNRYRFNFSSVCQPDAEASGINLVINQTATADVAKQMNVTNNDFLRKIVIYNADSDFFVMKENYTLSVSWNNNTTTQIGEEHAYFEPASNQTIFNGLGMYDLPLWEIQNIQFDVAKAN